jgi:16S rRNA (guanine966-N2)-methyltransferase
VTRIISGFAGSRELKVPKSGTRPTSDRVREAIFSALEARDVIEGANVLDLYAGSGALGLEAMSRGAAHATFVEKSAPAAGLLRSNCELITSAGKLPASATRVTIAPVISYLNTTAEREFDLVFIDPPYDLAENDVSSMLEHLVSHVASGADIVFERSSRSPEPTLPENLSLTKSKAYGETTVHWITAN